jgi:hypothetical protein
MRDIPKGGVERVYVALPLRVRGRLGMVPLASHGCASYAKLQ